MRKFVAVLLVAGVLALGSAALAGEQISLYCVNMPGCCEITCVTIDVNCCGCDWGKGPLQAEFLDCKGNVLGTATFACGWCNGETYGELDKPVFSGDVASVRLIKPQDDDVIVTWASLRVYCGDECHGKWYKVFKGDLWCWEPLPAPAPVAEPAPAPAPVEQPAVEEPQSEWVPEPQPAVEPEAKPEPEVIVVPGRG